MEGQSTERPIGVREAGQILNRSDGAIRNLAWRKKIPYYKVEGRLLFFESELLAFVRSSPGKALDDLLSR